MQELSCEVTQEEWEQLSSQGWLEGRHECILGIGGAVYAGKCRQMKFNFQEHQSQIVPPHSTLIPARYVWLVWFNPVWWDSFMCERDCQVCMQSAMPPWRCYSTHFNLISSARLIQVAQLMMLPLPWASSRKGGQACTQPHKYALI